MITITDRDYYPLPVENRDLEIKALDLAFRVMKHRQAGRFDLGAAKEAELGAVCRQAEGGSRREIEGVQRILQNDMDRRRRDEKPKLRALRVVI